MNLEGAAANGIKTEAFFYTQAPDVATAINEAKYVLELVREYPISYPIAYDVESQHLLDSGLSKQQITESPGHISSPFVRSMQPSMLRQTEGR